MRRYIIAIVLALTAAGLLVPSAMACEMQECPVGPGPGFGQHVADMTSCPHMDGQMMGAMVSSMAQGDSCPM